jgi:hypothetical protein
MGARLSRSLVGLLGALVRVVLRVVLRARAGAAAPLLGLKAEGWESVVATDAARSLLAFGCLVGASLALAPLALLATRNCGGAGQGAGVGNSARGGVTPPLTADGQHVSAELGGAMAHGQHLVALLQLGADLERRLLEEGEGEGDLLVSALRGSGARAHVGEAKAAVRGALEALRGEGALGGAAVRRGAEQAARAVDELSARLLRDLEALVSRRARDRAKLHDAYLALLRRVQASALAEASAVAEASAAAHDAGALRELLVLQREHWALHASDRSGRRRHRRRAPALARLGDGGPVRVANLVPQPLSRTRLALVFAKAGEAGRDASLVAAAERCNSVSARTAAALGGGGVAIDCAAALAQCPLVDRAALWRAAGLAEPASDCPVVEVLRFMLLGRDKVAALEADFEAARDADSLRAVAGELRTLALVHRAVPRGWLLPGGASTDAGDGAASDDGGDDDADDDDSGGDDDDS